MTRRLDMTFWLFVSPLIAAFIGLVMFALPGCNQSQSFASTGIARITTTTAALTELALTDHLGDCQQLATAVTPAAPPYPVPGTPVWPMVSSTPCAAAVATAEMAVAVGLGPLPTPIP